MRDADRFFYAAPQVRLGNNYVATDAKPAEGRALARALNQVVAKHCRVQRPSKDKDEEFEFLRSLSRDEARLFRLMLIAVKRVVDTSGE